jgi:hypothetical protein
MLDFLVYPFSLTRRSDMGQLRDRMAQDLPQRSYSPATRRTYLLYCRKLAVFHRRSPVTASVLTRLAW